MNTKRLFPWLTAAALVPGVACDSQVGTGYSGESMLNLHGSVTLTDPNATDLVPVLAFAGNDGTNNLYFLVDANVQGQFPSGFQMNITTPPPPSAIIVEPTNLDGSPTADFKGKMAFGYIAVAPRQHPATLPALVFGDWSDLKGPTGAGPWTGQERLCAGLERSQSSGGICIHQSLECKPRSCQLVAELPITQSFAAEAGPVNFLLGSMAWIFEGPSSIMPMKTTCSDDQTCHADVYSCDPPGPNEQMTLSTDGAAETCRVLGVQADPTFSGSAPQLLNAATGVAVMYLTERNAIPGLGTMGPGYVLYQTIPQATKEKEAAMRLCEEQAWRSAGCSPFDIACRVRVLQNTDCPWTDHYRLLQSPISDSLTLTMSPMTGLR